LRWQISDFKHAQITALCEFEIRILQSQIAARMAACLKPEISNLKSPSGAGLKSEIWNLKSP